MLLWLLPSQRLTPRLTQHSFMELMDTVVLDMPTPDMLDILMLPMDLDMLDMLDMPVLGMLFHMLLDMLLSAPLPAPVLLDLLPLLSLP